MKNTLLFIILVFFILLLDFLLRFFTAQNRPSGQDLQIPELLTYTNKVHKYTVQYPSDWTIDFSQADNQENYQSSICCNTASLIISKGETKWNFYINQLYTGFDAQNECLPSSKCEFVTTNLSVLGYDIPRIVTRQTSSGKIISAHLGNPGFGQIGFSTPYVLSNHTKYFVNYSGPEIEKYLTILDQITSNLQYIK